MTPLPISFTKGKRTYTPLQRSGRVAFYSINEPHWPTPKYEVFIVEERKGRTFTNGCTTPAHEAMPSTESGGDHGWSFALLADAQQRFRVKVALKQAA